MNLSSFVGGRLRFKRDSQRSSAGVVIAVTSIATSFVVMIVAISIVVGFKDQIVRKLTGFNAQITVMPSVASPDGTVAGPITYNKQLEKTILKVAPDAKISLAINQPAVFKTDSAFQGVVLHGIGGNDVWRFVEENLVEGKVIESDSTDNNEIVISAATANALKVNAGQKLLTYFFDGNNLRTRNLKIAGIYDTHFSDFDNTVAFSTISLLQNVFDVDSTTVTSVEIRGLGNNDIDQISENLYLELLKSSAENSSETSTGEMYHLETLNTLCSLYINWLNLLDTNVAVIILLMAFVSAFTLISSLFIIILERVNMIGLFKALGATDSQIRRIFIFMAQRLVVRGLVIGNILGLGIILIQQHFHLIPLDAEAYYLNYVPMEFSWMSTIVLNIGVIVVSAIVLILPSYLISSMSPAKSIKYE